MLLLSTSLRHGKNYEISPFPQGLISFSRILNDQEIVVVANTNRKCTQSLNVVIDDKLNQPETIYDIIYSNKTNAVSAGRVKINRPGTVFIKNINTSCSKGPILSLYVTLQPLEVQILGKRLGS